jgi:hypothetical protein
LSILGRNAGDTTYNNIIIGDPDGAAYLYHAGVKILGTLVNGLEIYGTGVGASGQLSFNSSTLRLLNQNHGENIVIAAENTATGGLKILFQGDPDGAAELYYAGIKVFATATDGVNIYDQGTTNQVVQVVAIDGNYSGLYSYIHGQPIKFKGENLATGAVKTLFSADPDGSVELYHAGTKIFETAAASIISHGEVVSKADVNGFRLRLANNVTVGSMYSSSGQLRIANTSDGSPVRIEGDHVADGSEAIMFLADPDGAAELYHAGVKVFETNTINDGGVTIHSNLGTRSASFAWSTSLLQLIVESSGVNATSFDIYCDDAAGDPKQGFGINGGGAAELYYAGAKAFETAADGIKMGFATSYVRASGGDLAIRIGNNGNVALYWDGAEKVTTSTVGVTINGGVYMAERAAAGADTATRGQLWVRNDDGNVLMFTDGDGIDYTVDLTPV